MTYQRKTECPFVTSPFNECYVTSMSSQDIESMIYYCGENYEQCDIFKKHRAVALLPGFEADRPILGSTGRLPRYNADHGNDTAGNA